MFLTNTRAKQTQAVFWHIFATAVGIWSIVSMQMDSEEADCATERFKKFILKLLCFSVSEIHVTAGINWNQDGLNRLQTTDLETAYNLLLMANIWA